MWFYSSLPSRSASPPRRRGIPQLRLELLEDRCLLSYAIQTFDVPTPGVHPNLLVAGPDGAVWFVENTVFESSSGTTLGRITSEGQITEVPIPSPLWSAGQMRFGPDGNIWLAGRGFIGAMTPQSTFLQRYEVPSSLSQLSFSSIGFTFGPDGNIWYTEPYGDNLVGRLNPANGQTTEFPIPAYDVFGAGALIIGPDGNLWFNATSANHIGRVTTGGDIQVFPLPFPYNGPRGVTAGPDGNLWMTASTATADGSPNKILRLNTQGELTGQFTVPTPGSGAYSMTVGSDGALWFTELFANKIGRITTDGTVTDELPIPNPADFPEAGSIITGPDGNIWFNMYASNRIGKVVLPNQPPVIGSSDLHLSAGTVNEGDTLTLTGSFTDPGTPDTHTVLIDWGDGSPATTLSLAAGVLTFSAPHQYLDNPGPHPGAAGSYPISVTVADSWGASASAAIQVTVQNAAPTASMVGPADGVRGQALTFNLAASDPSPVDQGAGFSYTLDWGDGSPLQTIAPSPGNGVGVARDHVFTASGTYTVTLTATDRDGSLSAPVRQTVTITAASLQPDPLAPGQTQLAVGGTTGDDHIQITPSGSSGDLVVQVNGVNLGTFHPTSRVVAYGQAGDDDIQVAAGVTVPAWLYGDAGNDRLKGGSGNNVLLGGAGDDLLVGGGNRDILIGGAGADRIVGNAEDDILIAGSTAFDGNESALAALLAEWTSGRDYATRRANITGPATTGVNGPYFLQTSGPGITVFDDGSADVLTGSAGQDWFFANLAKDSTDSGVLDKVTDLSASEFASDLDFINS